jgi:hypothetical protein
MQCQVWLWNKEQLTNTQALLSNLWCNGIAFDYFSNISASLWLPSTLTLSERRGSSTWSQHISQDTPRYNRFCLLFHSINRSRPLHVFTASYCHGSGFFGLFQTKQCESFKHLVELLWLGISQLQDLYLYEITKERRVNINAPRGIWTHDIRVRTL